MRHLLNNRAGFAAILALFVLGGYYQNAQLIALPLSRLISDAVGQLLLGTPLDYAFSTGGTLLWLILVMVLGAVASLLPALNAARLTVREVLAYE